MKITARIKAFPKITVRIKELKMPLSGGFEEGYTQGLEEGYTKGQTQTVEYILGGAW